MAGLFASLFVTLTLVFLTIHLMPGDPAQAALSQSTASQDVLERRREALGLDLPIHVQFGRYLWRLLHGDLGVSWSAGQSVGFMIASQLAPSAGLAASSMLMAVSLGTVLGLSAAVGAGNRLSGTVRAISGFLLSMPVMFTSTFLVWVFALRLGWLPATGDGDLDQLVLPAAALSPGVAASISRVVDSGVTDVMRQPFMQTALAKGLSRRQAIFRHALRVGMLPALDVIALQAGYLLGGTVVVESVFARQGVGRLMLTAVLDKDLPVVQGVVILAAATYSLLNIAADIAHALLDPRIRLDV